MEHIMDHKILLISIALIVDSPWITNPFISSNHFNEQVNPLKTQGASVVVIVMQLDLQLPMQSVPITTEVLSSNPAQARFNRYIIIIWLSFSVTCDRSVVFSSSSTNKTDRHDIAEILWKWR